MGRNLRCLDMNNIVLKFVHINGEPYTTARQIEDAAEAVGGYDMYIYNGDHGGPRHPGTVVVGAVRKILSAPQLRKALKLLPSDSARLQFGMHQMNDDVVNYLIYHKVITKYDLSRDDSLNLFNPDAARAVIAYLCKKPEFELQGGSVQIMPRFFDNCILSPMVTAKPEDRPKGGLF